MKLLPKSELIKKQNAVKKQNIDEGKKLAIKIDSLRETAAETEASLAKFYSETIAQINKEIVKAAGKRDVLLGEVKELEEAKARAIEPITAHLLRLEQKQLALSDKEAEIKRKGEELRQLTEQSEKTIEQTKSTIIQIESMKFQTEVKLRETSTLHASILEESQSIRDDRSKLDLTIQSEEKRFAQLQEVLDNKEARLTAIEATLEEERRILLEEQIRLNDRTATLERTLNRLKK